MEAEELLALLEGIQSSIRISPDTRALAERVLHELPSPISASRLITGQENHQDRMLSHLEMLLDSPTNIVDFDTRKRHSNSECKRIPSFDDRPPLDDVQAKHSDRNEETDSGADMDIVDVNMEVGTTKDSAIPSVLNLPGTLPANDLLAAVLAVLAMASSET
ncbi:hypothetical protein EIP86_008103 [Pleurotus ostreatoroseus]|nr:hypothetical protein EIP86_008103 [Pleurotus ostreatoroseus]